jgi:hypothetical protein
MQQARSKQTIVVAFGASTDRRPVCGVSLNSLPRRSPSHTAVNAEGGIYWRPAPDWKTPDAIADSGSTTAQLLLPIAMWEQTTFHYEF